MSDSYETVGADLPSPGGDGKGDAAAQEAAHLKDATSARAKDVLDTAKGEATTVAHEVGYQAKDLYAQTRRELMDQAAVQQGRLADGLRSVGEELESMAQGGGSDGVASDIVRDVSHRLSGAATWLGDRDPGSVLAEVKRFARRSPGTFILGAALVGVVAGRLTRALATPASESSGTQGSGAAQSPPAPAPRLIDPQPGSITAAGSGAVDDLGAPLYAQTVAARTDGIQGDGDERSDSV